MTERLSRLPKWAQDHVENLETRLALRWPDGTPPKPIWTGNGDMVAPDFLRGETLWIVRQLMSGWTPEPITFDGDGYIPGKGTFTSLPRGEFYTTRDEAFSWARFRTCEDAARKLFRLERLEKEGRDDS